VVGSGPSGFYTAKYLLEKTDKDDSLNLRVDMLDKLPTPFGLVRYGVAPDHPEVKIVADQFTEVAKNPRFRFFGNVLVGSDSVNDTAVAEEGVEAEQTAMGVSVTALLKNGYSAVVLAYGAESNRQLGVPGETLSGILSAREFVNWYNGHPDFVHVSDAIDLSKTKSVVVIGQGNVALDCARLLAKPLEELQSTDLTAASLEQLGSSTVTDIHVVGRRGHVQAACTIKEFRELTRIPHVHVSILESELEAGRTASSEEEVRTKRPLKRITDLIATTAATPPPSDDAVDKTVHFRFFLSPIECRERVVDGVTTGEVGSVLFEKCALEGPPHAQKAISTGETEEIPCDLLLSAVGYKTLALPGVPFNTQSNTIPHSSGRVLVDSGDETSSVIPGVYVAGWCKRGPVGIVGSNISDAKETVSSVVADLAAVSSSITTSAYENDDPVEWLVRQQQQAGRVVVSWSDHLALDEEERQRGAACLPVAKPREKITSVEEMLRVINDKN